MISYLKGEIMYRGEGFVVLLCGSIGYEVYLPGNRAYNYFEGQEAAFCTYLYKREDALQLYGFSDWQERDIFLLLIMLNVEFDNQFFYAFYILFYFYILLVKRCKWQPLFVINIYCSIVCPCISYTSYVINFIAL